MAVSISTTLLPPAVWESRATASSPALLGNGSGVFRRGFLHVVIASGVETWYGEQAIHPWFHGGRGHPERPTDTGEALCQRSSTLLLPPRMPKRPPNSTRKCLA